MKSCVFRAAAVGVMTLGLITLAGCSRPVGTVKGKVTYMNKALKGGSVSFVSSEGRQSFSGEIGDDGSYSIANITGGDYKVCVDTSYLKPDKSVMGGMGGPGGKGVAPPGGDKGAKNMAPPKDAAIPEGYKASNPAEGQALANAKKYVEIPLKYKDTDKTDMSYTVTGGEQKYDIELK